MRFESERMVGGEWRVARLPFATTSLTHPLFLSPAEIPLIVIRAMCFGPLSGGCGAPEKWGAVSADRADRSRNGVRAAEDTRSAQDSPGPRTPTDRPDAALSWRRRGGLAW